MGIVLEIVATEQPAGEAAALQIRGVGQSLLDNRAPALVGRFLDLAPAEQDGDVPHHALGPILGWGIRLTLRRGWRRALCAHLVHFPLGTSGEYFILNKAASQNVRWRLVRTPGRRLVRTPGFR